MNAKPKTLVGAEVFHADRQIDRTDGRTDVTTLLVDTRSFAKAPKMWILGKYL
jgi:hypothetical protein